MGFHEDSRASRQPHVYVVVRDTGDGDGVFVFENDEDAFAYAIEHGGFDSDVTEVPIIDRDLAAQMIAEAKEVDA